jgi:probable phosphoglycerate mutase
MPVNIYLIRHGETEWSRLGRHTSTTDLPLTPVGEEEAHAAAGRLAGVSFARVLVSPRLRARRTCEIAGLADRAEIEPAVREWDYGDYEGLPSPEILAKRSGWNIYRDGCPGGESPEQITARADALVNRLRAEEKGNIAIFSHGHFLRVLAVRWVWLPIETGQRLFLGTASISILSYDNDRRERPVIALWNQR